MDQLVSGNSILGVCAWFSFPSLIIGLLRVSGHISVQIPPTHHPCQDAKPPPESTGVYVVGGGGRLEHSCNCGLLFLHCIL